MSLKTSSKYFLPYQSKWIADKSRFKIIEKSRRVGMTYAQSYEDVIDAARAKDPMDVWFSSADDSAAREYIRYCQHWVALYKYVATAFEETIIESDKDIKVYVIEFSSGKRINALSSNPKAFRSKGGKLVLDEFAFHEQPEQLWKAAVPILTWGFPVRVLSTYNGKSGRYYRMVETAKRGNNWSLHTITLPQAVDQGLADKILGRTLTPAERDAWIAELREGVGDEEAWQQEYLCNPVDEATAWLTYDLIDSVTHPDAGNPELYQGHLCYVGMDIARRRDLTVIWVIECIGDVFWTREVVTMPKGSSFLAQETELARVLVQYNVVRACLDQTGMGEKFVEDATRSHGSVIEGVSFTGPVKQSLSSTIKGAFEERRSRIPVNPAIRQSHHSIKKSITAAGNPRFDGESDQGHADEYWAHCLALHAAGKLRLPSADDFFVENEPAERLGWIQNFMGTDVARRFYF